MYHSPITLRYRSTYKYNTSSAFKKDDLIKKDLA